jgi:hypothetical protein
MRLVPATALSLRLRQQEFGASLPPSVVSEVDRNWAAARLKNPDVYDGLVLCVENCDEYRGSGELIVRPVRYRFVHFSELLGELAPTALAVSGVVVVGIAQAQLALVGQRNLGASRFPGCYEFAPSGSVEPDDVNAAGGVDIIRRFFAELREEVGLDREAIQMTDIIGTVHDREDRTLDVVVRAQASPDVTMQPGLFRSDEYDRLEFISPKTLLSDRDRIVPVTAAIADYL